MNENLLEDHAEKVPAGVALGLCIVSFLIALAAFVVLLVCADRPNGAKADRKRTISLVSCFSFLATTTLFLTYAGSLFRRDRQDYHGPMRILGVNYEERTISERSSESSSSSSTRTYETYLDAHFAVEWGSTWACPDHGNVVCTSTVVSCSQLICNRRSCSHQETLAAHDWIQVCSERYYDPTETGYVNYTVSDGPSSDIYWPNIVAYGNCDACTSTRNVASLEHIARAKTAGFVCLGITIALWVVLGLQWVVG